MKLLSAVSLLWCLLLAGSLAAQNRVPPPLPPAAGAVSQEPIPVTNPTVIAKCGTCHASDAGGNMQRISYARTTPEGWQDVLKQMILVNGLTVTPEEARTIVKYLSASHGLAPAESKPVMYDPERRINEEGSTPASRLLAGCAKCHTLSKSLMWRRTTAEWKQFADAHAAAQKFRPNDDAVTLLAGMTPLHSPEWDAWSKRTDKADLTGRWLVTASEPGRSTYYGEMQVDRTGEDEFTTRVTLTSIRDGERITRTGRSAVFGDSAWRGRSKGGVAAGAPPYAPESEAREVMWIAPDHLTAEGRWFWGQYQEFGFDVMLRRPDARLALLLTDKTALKTGTQANRIRVIGANLPAQVAPSDLQFGAGVRVASIVSHNATEIVATVDVAADATPGKRQVMLQSATLPQTIAVYDKVDYIKVNPESAMATFGDGGHPRGFRQFQAIGYQRGADGRAHTADDVELGPVVDVNWQLQVFHTEEGSNADQVGKMSADGLFTPAFITPNNNFDIWVNATAKEEKDVNGKPLAAKSYVVVTVPTYTFNGRRYVRDLDRWMDDGPAK